MPIKQGYRWIGSFRTRNLEMSPERLAYLAALRHRPQDEVYELVLELLDKGDYSGLEVAHRVLRDPRYFQHLLVRGIRPANRKYVRHWIDACFPHLGPHGTLKLLSAMVDKEREGVARTIYYLVPMVANADKRLLPDLLRLARAVAYTGSDMDALERKYGAVLDAET